MAASLLRAWIVGLVTLAALGFGVYFLGYWSDTGRSETAYLVGGLVLIAWTFTGRWLLVPIFGAKAFLEPEESRGDLVERVSRPDGTELQVELYGPSRRPTLVLTHGWEQDSTEWYYLKRDFPTVVSDDWTARVQRLGQMI